MTLIGDANYSFLISLPAVCNSTPAEYDLVALGRVRNVEGRSSREGGTLPAQLQEVIIHSRVRNFGDTVALGVIQLLLLTVALVTPLAQCSLSSTEFHYSETITLVYWFTGVSRRLITSSVGKVHAAPGSHLGSRQAMGMGQRDQHTKFGCDGGLSGSQAAAHF